ncbi:MAG: 50S ribosomal protein L35 [Micavibrio sp.]|nr:50S ribosomal protein L35 [Micavibrio sp.]
MPKMKTHSGVKKRFGVTATGKVKARSAHKRHRMTSKSKRMKREGRSTLIMGIEDATILLNNFLPYQRKLTRKKKKSTYVSKADRAKASKEAA